MQQLLHEGHAARSRRLLHRGQQQDSGDCMTSLPLRSSTEVVARTAGCHTLFSRLERRTDEQYTVPC
ncbi:hypothetical protein ACFYWX_38460 [Streptomyces sp. NPDC002888]|uniref:hypothetical protein n=1 Tax=Streptomyces sp. NPDC002888 TaxID=3364668 RepID=UPI0036BE7AF2